jgi:hypothetical protein
MNKRKIIKLGLVATFTILPVIGLSTPANACSAASVVMCVDAEGGGYGYTCPYPDGYGLPCVLK